MKVQNRFSTSKQMFSSREWSIYKDFIVYNKYSILDNQRNRSIRFSINKFLKDFLSNQKKQKKMHLLSSYLYPFQSNSVVICFHPNQAIVILKDLTTLKTTTTTTSWKNKKEPANTKQLQDMKMYTKQTKGAVHQNYKVATGVILHRILPRGGVSSGFFRIP